MCSELQSKLQRQHDNLIYTLNLVLVLVVLLLGLTLSLVVSIIRHDYQHSREPEKTRTPIEQTPQLKASSKHAFLS